MDELQDFYAILDVPWDAPGSEIRRAFRVKAKKLHPDTHLAAEANPDLSEEFRLLTEAYDTLKDPARREAYDLELSRRRQLTAPVEVRHGGAFAKGLAAGLIIAVAAAGTKVYFDRATLKNGSFKSQDSLRAVKPSTANSASSRPEGGEPIDGLSAITPAPKDTAAPPESGEQGEKPESASASGGASPAFRPSGGGEDRAPQVVGEAQGETEGAAAADGLQKAQSPERPGASGGHSIALKSVQTPAGVFATSIISLETELTAGKENNAVAYRLLSLVNSSTALDELTTGAAVAKRADTQNLINGRIAALRENAAPLSTPSEPHQPALSGTTAKPHPKPGTIDIAIGLGPYERAVYLTPGAGLSEGFSDCSGCPEMAVIPAGQSMVGSRPENTGFRPEEAPAHRVMIRKPLAISKHWITAGEWRVCVEAGVCRATLASFLAAGSDVPVSRVSWYDAIAYVDWLSRLTGHHYRLLSEAEWEYAAQAQGHRALDLSPKPAPSGGRPIPEFNMLRFGGRLKHLGAWKANGWGLYAMPGGVLEWVEDCWHPNYAQAPADGSAWRAGAGGDCSYRVVRGGIPSGTEPDDRRIVARAREFTDARAPTLGFRVARELASPAKTALGSAPSPAAGN